VQLGSTLRTATVILHATINRFATRAKSRNVLIGTMGPKLSTALDRAGSDAVSHERCLIHVDEATDDTGHKSIRLIRLVPGVRTR
jgi:hypothetical protein